MSSLTTGLAARVAIRVGVGVTLAVSGVIHAYLYVHGYRHIAMIGPSFLLQASVSCALAVLILAGGPKWLQWAGGALAAASLAAFVLSRTVGLVSFSEAGWQPAPEAALSVVAEVLTVAFVAAATITGRGSA
jgi:hypothetical protein